MLLKVHYGNERIHFEVWADGNRGFLEIGLHFEDGPASTAAYLAFFDARIVEIKHLLGAEVELERWTASWGHLFESRNHSCHSTASGRSRPPLGWASDRRVTADGRGSGHPCRRTGAAIRARARWNTACSVYQAGCSLVTRRDAECLRGRGRR